LVKFLAGLIASKISGYRNFAIVPILGHSLNLPKWVKLSNGYFLEVLIPISLAFLFLGPGKDMGLKAWGPFVRARKLIA
jgi:hypothetical protein